MFYKVLIVDDEEIVCNGLKMFVKWEECGYQVAGTANSVAQALVFMESNDVDVVISDIKMPVQDGLQLLEVIQEEYPDVKTIVLSGYGEFECAQKAMRLGAVDFLTKPVSFSEIKKLLVKLGQALETEHRESLDKQEYKRLKLNNLLNSLSKGYMDNTDCKDKLPFEMDDRDYFLLRIQLDAASYREIEEFKKKIERTVEKIIYNFGQAYLYNNDIRQMACLFWPDGMAKGSEMLFGEALSSTLRAENISSTVGISERQNSFSELKMAYLQAGKAVQYRMIKNKSSVICFSQIDNLLCIDNPQNKEFNQKVLTCLNDPVRRKEMLPFILSKIDEIGEAAEYRNQLYAFCIQTMLMVNDQLQNFDGQKIDLSDELYELIRKLLLTDSVEEIKSCVTDYIKKIVEKLDPLDEAQTSGGIINNVKFYIREHYAEDINLNMLADRCYVHPIYLSRLFKEKTNMNFIDYVTEVRINKSKELLKDKQYKIYDVSRMVGYESSCYFSKLFKNIVKMTPKQYRETV